MISNTITTTLFPTNGDDYIGNESCIDLRNENDVVIDHCETSKSNGNDDDDDPGPTNQAYDVKNSSRRRMEKRVFPPPIPLLARTENLACHMPWVLRRYYTSEGRLILKEEKVKYHEYFQAHRENGRLTLQLVPLDDDEDQDEVEEAATSSYDDEDTRHDESKIINSRFEDDEEVKSSSNIVLGDEFLEAASTSPHDETHDDQSIIITNNNRFALEEEEEEEKTNIQLESDNVVGGGANGGPKCMNCSSVRTSAPSCFFGVQCVR
ncbi:hypothetical protein RIF29_16849 [Crotalaria pallida]|uniref:FAF domain-containing protein n=1 Tax=Crotalaria pallida TaxID=3830 RepID=A0AAN9FG12_CROPI